MSPVSKRRSRPKAPDVFTSLMDQLENILGTEYVFTPHVQIMCEAQEPGDITTGIRDGSLNVLRCLKMWYDLSSDVFIVAVNIIDRFLTKMKVRSKHMACISVSGLYIACKLLNEPVNPNDLVNISQSKCTAADMQRMVEIIISKLKLDLDSVPTTAITFLKIYSSLFEAAAHKLDLGNYYQQVINERELCKHLEIVICDARCSNLRPSVIAIVLLYTQLEYLTRRNIDHFVSLEIFKLIAFTIELKNFCRISDDDFFECHEKVIIVLDLYNEELKIPHRQHLVWKVSNRTMKKLRPTRQLTYFLPTIDEDAHYACNELVQPVN